MATKFSIPSSPDVYTKVNDTFLGIDYSSDADTVTETRSPWAPNMIRDVPGKVRKCMGYEKITTYDGAVNGAHILRQGDEDGAAVYRTFIHAGTNLYRQDTGEVVFDSMANVKSRSWQLDQALWVQDGENLLKITWTELEEVDEETEEETEAEETAVVEDVTEEAEDAEEETEVTLEQAQDIAYIPTLTISKDPTGGGSPYEAYNLIQEKYTELFFGDGSSKNYYMSLTPLNDVEVVVEIMNTSTGVWSTMTENSGFTVDRTNGIITFSTAPANGVGGEDNVSITAAKTVEGYSERVFGCTTGILYGVSGLPDRLFISGNSEYLNYDWYSGQNDPSYWPDTGYAVLGSAASAVMGYCIINNYLAAYKDQVETDRNIFIRTGSLTDEGEPSFPIYNILQGPGVTSKWSTAYLESEPLALTPYGIYALTTSDVTGERYSENRSWYADNAMLKLNVTNAYATVFNNMCWVCFEDAAQAYIFDGLQTSTNKNQPYSTRIYSAFHRTNLPARVMWAADGGARLWFGDSDGNVYRFYDEVDDLLSYSDDGAVVGGEDGCCWTTPDFVGSVFFQVKNFRWLALQLAAKSVTGVKMYGMQSGIWSLLLDSDSKARYLDFSQIDFSKFSFSGDSTNRTIWTKTRIKKADKTRYRFENNEINEPFGLMSYGIDYTQPGGRYKK